MTMNFGQHDSGFGRHDFERDDFLRCVNGRHVTNVSNVKIFRHTFVSKIGQICIPYKFAQSTCIPSKIKGLVPKGSRATLATRGDLAS